MGSRTKKPIFENGVYVINGKDGRQLELTEKTWTGHILKNRNRRYLEAHFDKVLDVLASPDYVLQSPSEKNVVSFAKFYDDFNIIGTVTVRAYLYVLVNLNNNKIRTIYTNERLKGWEQL